MTVKSFITLATEDWNNSPNVSIRSQNIYIKPLETFKYLTANHVSNFLLERKYKKFFGLLHFSEKSHWSYKSSPMSKNRPIWSPCLETTSLMDKYTWLKLLLALWELYMYPRSLVRFSRSSVVNPDMVLGQFCTKINFFLSLSMIYKKVSFGVYQWLTKCCYLLVCPCN